MLQQHGSLGTGRILKLCRDLIVAFPMLSPILTGAVPVERQRRDDMCGESGPERKLLVSLSLRGGTSSSLTPCSASLD